MVGVALVGFITILASSTKASTAQAVDTSLRADYVIDSGAFGGQGGFGPSIGEDLAALPEVEVLSPLRSVPVTVGDSSREVKAFDTAVIEALVDFETTAGAISDINGNGIGLSVDRAEELGVGIGDTVTIGFSATGDVPLIVRALFDGELLASGGMDQIVGLDTFEANVTDQFDQQVYLSIPDDVGATAATEAIESVLAAWPNAELLTPHPTTAADGAAPPRIGWGGSVSALLHRTADLIAGAMTSRAVDALPSLRTVCNTPRRWSDEPDEGSNVLRCPPGRPCRGWNPTSGRTGERGRAAGAGKQPQRRAQSSSPRCRRGANTLRLPPQPSVAARRARAIVEPLRSNFFFLPAIAVVVAFVAARLLVGVEAFDWVGRSTVESARSVLSTTAAATITFASVTFSVSLLIMQQGSSQFSPRVIHGLTRDPFNRRVIALVVGTFTYCLVSLQRVRGPLDGGGEELVPELAVAVGLVLGVLSVLAVVAAINHTSRKMDVSVILSGIVDEATTGSSEPLTDDRFRVTSPSGLPAGGGSPGTVVRFDTDGWIQRIDRRGLLSLAEPGSTIRLDTDAGRYAIRSTALCTIWPVVPDHRLDELTIGVRRLVRVGPTRTMSEDPGYGVRQLVDVALRALSPGINDPTTAMDAIFHLGTVLVDRLSRPPAPLAYRDDQDRHLLTPHVLTDTDLAELALSELRGTTSNQPTVAVYLLQMIGLVVDAPTSDGEADRTHPFLEQARLVVETVKAGDALEVDRRRVQQTYADLFAS